MKIALCFIISYDHILNKEHLWREWIEPNKDIINVYFYYKDIKKIKSVWIKKNALPQEYIYDTSYYHVIPAYVSILKYAIQQDSQNKWFCMLTDSCCPIISPKKFRYLFYNHSSYSLFSWKNAWWNPYFHKRGNLLKLPDELWLANDPWFILTKKNAKQVLQFISTQKALTLTICSGGLANETLFAVIFKYYRELEAPSSSIKCVSTHMVDWNRRSTTTSPHIFKCADEQDISFIESELERNEYVCFIRKVSPEFPDEILTHYIYEHNKEKIDSLNLTEPFESIYNRYKMYVLLFCGYAFIAYFTYILFV